MAVLDDFNRADNASLGAGYTEVDGAWSIVSNKLRCVSGTAPCVVEYTGIGDLADLRFGVRVSNASGGSDGGPIVRYNGGVAGTTGANNLATGYFADAFGSTLELFRYVSGQAPVSLQSSSITLGVDSLIEIQVSGSGTSVAVKVFQNNTQIGATYNDSSADRITAADAQGVVSWVASNNANADFDDLTQTSTATAALSGTLPGSTEADIVAGGKTVILTVTGDEWCPAAGLATIQYVGGQTGSFAGKTGTTSVNFALTNGLAATPAANDLVIITYGVGSTADRALTIQNASAVDYTLAGTELFSDDTFDANHRTAYRFMPGTPETSFVLSGTGSTADAGSYTVHVFRRVDSASPLSAAVVTATGINTRLANPGSVTPTHTGAIIYVAGVGACGTAAAFTAGYLTDFRSTPQADTNDVVVGAGYVAWTSGAYDPAAFAGGGTDTTSDSWSAVTIALKPAATTPFDDARQAVINGLDSAQSEANGWDATVKTAIPVANVVRTSNTVATITLPAVATYDITANEVITATIPATALVGATQLIATPTATITPVAAEISGVLAASLDAVAVSSAGTVEIQGVSAVTLDGVSLATSGTVDVQGTASLTLDAVTVSATGTVGTLEIAGELDQALASVTVSSSGTVDVQGSSAVTLDAVTVAAAGGVEIQGAVSASIASVTGTSAGTVEVQGQSGVTLEALTSTAAGTVDVQGAAAVTLAAVTSDSQGVVGNAPLEGTLSQTLGAVTASAIGQVEVSAVASLTLGAVSGVSAGTIEVGGTLDVTLAPITAVATGTTPVTGEATVTLEPITGELSGAVEVQGVFAQALAPVTLVAVQSAPWIYGESVRVLNISLTTSGLRTVQATVPGLRGVYGYDEAIAA